MSRRFILLLTGMWIIFLLAIGLLFSAKLKKHEIATLTKVNRPDGRDVITVWAGVILGRWDDIGYRKVVDQFNRIHDKIFIQLECIPYAVYLPKINIAVATGQPPDVVRNALAVMQNVRTRQKSADLAVPIPDSMITPEQRARWGRGTLAAISHMGRKYTFPDNVYLSGQVFLGNREYFEKAGVNLKYYLENGWDYDTFIRELKKVQEVARRETGSDDAYAYAINLVNIDPMLYGSLLPQVVGPEVMKRGLLIYDEAYGRYFLDPEFTPQKLALPMGLMQRMIRENLWGKRFLGMQAADIGTEIVKKRLLASIFANTPGDAFGSEANSRIELQKGLTKSVFYSTSIPAPVPRQGMPLVFEVGADGWGVMKQIPWKGDQHTSHALYVAKYLASPQVSAELYRLSKFRAAIWPEMEKVLALVPDVPDSMNEDPWLIYLWDLYSRWSRSPNNFGGEEIIPPEPDERAQVTLAFSWGTGNGYLGMQGHQILEAVLYGQRDALDGATEMIAGCKRAIDRYYELHPEAIGPK